MRSLKAIIVAVGRMYLAGVRGRRQERAAERAVRRHEKALLETRVPEGLSLTAVLFTAAVAAYLFN